MVSAQVVETSVTSNSPSQDSNHPDDLFQSRYVTPGFKPFSEKNVDYYEKKNKRPPIPLIPLIFHGINQDRILLLHKEGEK